MSFCTNKYLSEDEFYEWEFHNPFLKRTYMIKDRIVDWEGRKARLEMSHDNYSLEFKLAKRNWIGKLFCVLFPAGW